MTPSSRKEGKLMEYEIKQKDQEFDIKMEEQRRKEMEAEQNGETKESKVVDPEEAD